MVKVEINDYLLVFSLLRETVQVSECLPKLFDLDFERKDFFTVRVYVVCLIKEDD